MTLYDGSFHTVDSSEAAFKTAGREAFKKAFMAAKPCLLEPIVNIEIHVPSQFMGDITGDLNSRRGKIESLGQRNDAQVIRAHVPLSEMFGYSTDMRSITQGRAIYTMQFHRYESVPKAIADEIVAASTGMAA